MSHLIVKDLEKRVDEFSLGPVNFTVEPGTVIAIVGENGSGKSTLIKTIMNLWKRDKGRVKVLGKETVNDYKWKEHVAYQGQKAYGYDIYTLDEMHRFIKIWYPQFNDALFDEMVEQLKLPKHKRFEKLSEGMQQKMTLALTIPRNTDLMILDEPTSSIDIPTKKYITDLLIKWLDEKERSLIIASHETEDIRKLADYLLIIKDGQQLDFVEKETLLERYMKVTYQQPMIEKLPGEISRTNDQEIIIEKHTIDDLPQKDQILFESRLDLDEVISILLS